MTKKGFKLPHTFVIIILIVLAATAMTWIIPAGEYVRYENASGTMVIDPNQFSYIQRSPVNPLLIPLFIVNAICGRIDFQHNFDCTGDCGTPAVLGTWIQSDLFCGVSSDYECISGPLRTENP